MTEKFAEYLAGSEIHVRIDNNLFAHLGNAKLENYRKPAPSQDEELEDVEVPGFGETARTVAAARKIEQEEACVNLLEKPRDEWVQVQQEDPELAQLRRWVVSEQMPSRRERRSMSPEGLSRWPFLHLLGGSARRTVSRRTIVGFTDVDVIWRGTRGLMWFQVLPEVVHIARVSSSLTVVVIHAGGNDLASSPLAEHLTLMRSDMDKFPSFFSAMRLVWSKVIPRLVWRGARELHAMERSRRTLNQRISHFVRFKNGGVVKHHRLEGDNTGFLLPDGVHLNDAGLDIFLNGIREGVMQRSDVHSAGFPAPALSRRCEATSLQDLDAAAILDPEEEIRDPRSNAITSCCSGGVREAPSLHDASLYRRNTAIMFDHVAAAERVEFSVVKMPGPGDRKADNLPTPDLLANTACVKLWRQMAGALGMRPPCSAAGGQEEQQEDPGT
ncbi:unnamed protein product [Ranitomeya imitator]|uniref:SGNH hydrolase-type esterase domain-containing protein n=1 Tax=Ranitomeya imitator TaxID=111125 RepID=A0ABN9MI25_9NEOB|nr:unnamed protein product [Ranitomeya imitator]